MGGGGETDVEQFEAQDAWIFRRSLGHVRMANLIVYAKIAVPSGQFAVPPARLTSQRQNW